MNKLMNEIALEAQRIASAALKMAGGLFPPVFLVQSLWKGQNLLRLRQAPAFFFLTPLLAALSALLLYFLVPSAPIPALLSALTALAVGAWLLPRSLGREEHPFPAASAVALASTLSWALGSFLYWKGLHGGSLLEVAFGGTAAILGYAYLFPHLEAGLAQMEKEAEPPQ